jgi:hypothetical protein
VVVVLGTTAKVPAPATVPLKGQIPIENEPLVVDVRSPLVTPEIGPRMRTSLASMGNALAATTGVTVTVAADRLTTLDAARLKFSASRDDPLDVTLNESLGSRFTVSWI